MASRSRKILAMIQPGISSHPGNQNHNLSIPKTKELQKPDSPLVIGNLSYASSSGTDSIPDSQIGMDVSWFDDTDEKIDSKMPDKKPDIVIEESSNSSTSESSSSSDSDTSESTSTDSSNEDFSSDDSVKDPDFQIATKTVSDSDNERDSSPTPEKVRIKVLKKSSQNVLIR